MHKCPRAREMTFLVTWNTNNGNAVGRKESPLEVHDINSLLWCPFLICRETAWEFCEEIAKELWCSASILQAECESVLGSNCSVREKEMKSLAWRDFMTLRGGTKADKNAKCQCLFGEPDGLDVRDWTQVFLLKKVNLPFSEKKI